MEELEKYGSAENMEKLHNVDISVNNSKVDKENKENKDNKVNKNEKTLSEVNREISNSNLRPGRGRPKGSKNIVTKTAKEAFHLAFEKTGGARKLIQWASKNDTNYREFIKLYSKLIPVDVTSQEEKIVVREISNLSDAELVKLLAEANSFDALEGRKN